MVLSLRRSLLLPAAAALLLLSLSTSADHTNLRSSARTLQMGSKTGTSGGGKSGGGKSGGGKSGKKSDNAGIKSVKGPSADDSAPKAPKSPKISNGAGSPKGGMSTKAPKGSSKVGMATKAPKGSSKGGMATKAPKDTDGAAKGSSKVGGVAKGSSKGTSPTPSSPSPEPSSPSPEPTFSQQPTDIPTISSAPVPDEPLVTRSPSAEPVAAPPAVIQVGMGDFYMSYVTSDNTEPTEAEYEQLRQLNIDHFGGAFADAFASDPDIEFESLQLILRETRHGSSAGIPDGTFNIYMDYEDALLTFSETSVGIPDANELFIIYKDGLTTEYLLQMRADLTGTPFATVNEGFTEREGTLVDVAQDKVSVDNI